MKDVTFDDQAPLIADAMKAYGLKAEEVLAARVLEDGEVVLVTIGGHKARWRRGQVVTPLSDFHAGRRPPQGTDVRAAARQWAITQAGVREEDIVRVDVSNGVAEVVTKHGSLTYYAPR